MIKLINIIFMMYAVKSAEINIQLIMTVKDNSI